MTDLIAAILVAATFSVLGAMAWLDTRGLDD